MILRSRCCYAPFQRASWLSSGRWPRPNTDYRCLTDFTRHELHLRSRSINDRYFTSSSRSLNDFNGPVSSHATLQEFKNTISFPASTCSFTKLASEGHNMTDSQIVLHGYLGTRRDASKSLTFAELHDTGLQSTIQLVSTPAKGVDGSDSPHQLLRSLEEHTPVAVDGTVKAREAPKSSKGEGISGVITGVEIKVDNIVPLNAFPKDLIMTEDTVFSPGQRHLQLRNDDSLRQTLRFRSKATGVIRDELCTKQDFTEIETPLLFKSTPEGAREFLVPTREPGFAYALPQSPQQYKQILMASGIPRYMQIAKCFRDEDLRADRQPEFTQVDLEMAFASGEDVIRAIELVIRRLWAACLDIHDLAPSFPRMSYEEAMTKYGSDKPDLRFDAELHRIEYMLPVDLIQKIGPLSEPAVDVMKFSYFDEDPQKTRKFVAAFMDSPQALPFIQNPDGQPGIFIYDVRKPLSGLQPFGFEAAEQLEEMLDLQNGDVVVLQARKNEPFHGGSTPIGNLRLALQKAAIEQGIIHRPTGFKFTWITDFPLFSPSNDTEPGQGGSAGISSTHHPFTSPKTPEDVDLLLSDPLAVKADHYDLVVNGVELGGGSRRIHNFAMQEFIMREILKMSDERMKDFAHLLEVLRAGCPPHAGIALGFDRLIAVMLGRESVRDVIAFPKSGKGEDLLVKSPSKMTEEQMRTYHLKLR